MEQAYYTYFMIFFLKQFSTGQQIINMQILTLLSVYFFINNSLNTCEMAVYIYR